VVGSLLQVWRPLNFFGGAATHRLQYASPSLHVRREGNKHNNMKERHGSLPRDACANVFVVLDRGPPENT
jgi:hypothetical protein